jgi:hypothetical protein
MSQHLRSNPKKWAENFECVKVNFPEFHERTYVHVRGLCPDESFYELQPARLSKQNDNNLFLIVG